ncbi:hypothetical protein Snoj_08170 [Streptomyces nojiriensis]|uniref:Integral membrane protein n=1 Tax=Streptomyces nojiriensis TaxID=66374 RepID=A0ABQ3SFK5_9ACTN|nr:hypothetical protein [Streptomyces nojiriensis]QTI48541.1 hypothetical protein JYK04_06405 [Streptomyces nojiriensis]GHI66899.1 hypothetical protein Snoj_08170 [Streptomyces nojiriensis]
MHQKRSYAVALVVSTLVGCLEVALTVVVVLLYVQTQPPPDRAPDYTEIGGSLVALTPLIGFISFLLSLIFVLPAVALADLLGRRLGRHAAWWSAPLIVAALVASPIWIVAAYNDAETRATLVFWASATASLSAGALIALPRGEGLLRRVVLWGTGVVAGTGLFGALGLAVGLLPAYEPPAIGPQTMPGSWIDHTGNTLVFTSDGRVTASGVGGRSPNDYPGDPSPSCSGSGTWVYEGGRDVWTQKVRIDIPGCGWPAWGVGGTAREPRIHQHVGDPGSGELYKLRKASGGS